VCTFRHYYDNLLILLTFLDIQMGLIITKTDDEQFSLTTKTRCWLPERFASAWPKLIIACDVRGRGEWLHRCSWPPLVRPIGSLLAHSMHSDYRQTDRRTDITTGIHIASFAFTGSDAKKTLHLIFKSFLKLVKLLQQYERHRSQRLTWKDNRGPCPRQTRQQNAGQSRLSHQTDARNNYRTTAETSQP